MRAFFVRWRRARAFREFEMFADENIAPVFLYAMEAAGGGEVWRGGTLWKCPGCGDCTIRTEEFAEAMRRAESALLAKQARNEITEAERHALEWIEKTALLMLGCERDRVYVKDASGRCPYEGQTYLSRI